jgi:acetyltransferase-like isoleucine patch superfamily enzyme
MTPRARIWQARQKLGAKRLEAQTGLRVPSDSSVWQPRLITGGSRIAIGHGVRIRPGVRLETVPQHPANPSGPSGRIVIEDAVQFEDYVTVASAISISIGRGCVLASFAFVTDSDHTIPPLGQQILGQPVTFKPTVLGENVWVGHCAVILKGVTVGDRATVGAGAVVTKDVPPDTAVGGVPARTLIRPDDLDPELDLG